MKRIESALKNKKKMLQVEIVKISLKNTEYFNVLLKQRHDDNVHNSGIVHLPGLRVNSYLTLFKYSSNKLIEPCIK